MTTLSLRYVNLYLHPLNIEPFKKKKKKSSSLTIVMEDRREKKEKGQRDKEKRVAG